MCRDCGCSLGPAANRAPLAAQAHSHAHAHAPGGHVESIEVITRILDENDRVAAHNRTHFDEHGVLAINLMSSPGSGKTALLESTIKALDGQLKLAAPMAEYEAIYEHFAALLASGQSYVDTAPLELMGDCFMKGRRAETEAFVW
mgnify:CR=1 FL=1